MGGRVAEEIIFCHAKVTSGASSDIQMDTKLAKYMVTKFGISKKSYPNIDISNLTEEEAIQIYYEDFSHFLLKQA